MHSDLFLSVEHNFYKSVEQLCNKVSLAMITFESSLSIEKICDKVLCKIVPFDLSSSVEQRCKDGAVIFVLTG